MEFFVSGVSLFASLISIVLLIVLVIQKIKAIKNPKPKHINNDDRFRDIEKTKTHELYI